jgi:hypothetical protein
MIPVQVMEIAWPPFSNLRFCSSKVRDDKLGSSNQFSAAEKDEGRVIYIVGLKNENTVPLMKRMGARLSPCLTPLVREELFKILPNIEVDRNIRVQLLEYHD